jgi:hypothetical protein
MRSCLGGKQKELARILMQYIRCGYGCAPSTCSESPLSAKLVSFLRKHIALLRNVLG